MSVPGRARGLVPDHPSPPCPFPRCSPCPERADAAPGHLRPSGAGSCRCASLLRGWVRWGRSLSALCILGEKPSLPAGHGAFFAALPWLPAEAAAAAHGLAPARPRCPHRPSASALRGRGCTGAPRPCAGQVYSPQKPLRGSSRQLRQERRSPRRNRDGGEKGKKKLKSKDPTFRRIKARRGASSFELPLFFFLNFYFPSAPREWKEAGGRQVDPRGPAGRCAGFLQGGEAQTICPPSPRQVAQQRSGTRDASQRCAPAGRPQRRSRMSAGAGRPRPGRPASPWQPPLSGTRRRGCDRTRPCAEPGSVPRALRVPCPSIPTMRGAPGSSSCLPVRRERAQPLYVFSRPAGTPPQVLR